MTKHKEEAWGQPSASSGRPATHKFPAQSSKSYQTFFKIQPEKRNSDNQSLKSNMADRMKISKGVIQGYIATFRATPAMCRERFPKQVNLQKLMDRDVSISKAQSDSNALI
ncbi:hypothetical protein [Endozoicomonas sp. ONNA1]|uniref:hypothetical protein n=2 Tax=Endozoicomonas TaxID=305899 RepID=UPI0021492778|nr:hypothetical protein [Endozoicomonas sp. ONNA1]